MAAPFLMQRRAAVWLLRQGALGVAEIAEELSRVTGTKISRQSVRMWAESAGFDYRRVRRDFKRRWIERAIKSRE